MKGRELPCFRAFVFVVVLSGILSGFPTFARGTHEVAREKRIGNGVTVEDRQDVIPLLEGVRLHEGEKLRIVATTSIVGDVVANVAGAAADLTGLIGVGQDPHSYEPTPQALAAVESAHIVFVNGFDLEETLLETIGNTAAGKIIPLSAGIEPRRFEGDEHSSRRQHGNDDPHVWMAPTNVMMWVKSAEHALSAADPANSVTYATNASRYVEKLKALDTSIRRSVSTIPAGQRKLVTDHHLLGYFADEYGFRIVASLLPGTGAGASVSARRVAELVRLLRAEDVHVILVGNTAGRGLSSLAKAVASETGREVEIVEMLTGSLAPRGQMGDTYLSYMEFNLSQIMKALSP